MSIYGNFALKSCNEFYAVETKDPNLLFMEFDMIAKDLKCDIFESVISITESSDDYYITEGKIWDGIKSIFGRIKDAILTALGKLKEIFQSVWAKIRGKKHKETVKAYKEEKKNEPIGSHPGKALRNPIPGTSDKQLPATVDNNKQLPATTSNDRQLPAAYGGNDKQLPAIASQPFKGWIDFSKVSKILAFRDRGGMYKEFGIQPVIDAMSNTISNINSGRIYGSDIDNLAADGKTIFPECVLGNAENFFGSDLTLQQFDEKCGSFHKDYVAKYGINVTLQQFKSNLKTYVYEDLYMAYGGNGERDYKAADSLLRQSLKEVDRFSKQELKIFDSNARNNNDYEKVNSVKKMVTLLASVLSSCISGLKSAYNLQTRMAAAEVKQIHAIMTYFG